MRWLAFPALTLLAATACHKSPAPAASPPASPAKATAPAASAPAASAPAASAPAAPSATAPALAVGSEAPDFALPGTDGKVHRLADDRGKRAVVLAWYPKAFTGG